MPEKPQVTDGVREVLADVIGRIRRVQVTCLDDAGNEIITQFFAIRSGQTLTYKVPESGDITISMA